MTEHFDIKASSIVQCTLYKQLLDVAWLGKHTDHTTTTILNTSLGRSAQSFLFSPNTHSSTYVSGERQQGRLPGQVVANDGPGFLSATTSILSELDDSACQRHRSVGGFLLRLAAYVKRILHHHKKYSNPRSTQNSKWQAGMENTQRYVSLFRMWQQYSYS